MESSETETWHRGRDRGHVGNKLVPTNCRGLSDHSLTKSNIEYTCISGVCLLCDIRHFRTPLGRVNGELPVPLDGTAARRAGIVANFGQCEDFQQRTSSSVRPATSPSVFISSRAFSFLSRAESVEFAVEHFRGRLKVWMMGRASGLSTCHGSHGQCCKASRCVNSIA